MSTIDRRRFVLGASAALALPLVACGGGGDSWPPLTATTAPTVVSAKGVRFAAVANSNAIEITNASGVKRRVSGLGRDLGKFNYPADFAVLGETGYVVETGNHRVQVFDAAANALGTIGAGVLLYPGGIATTQDEILVSDSRNARIVGFDAQGHVTRMLGQGTLSAPRGLTATADSILVADPGLRQIVQLNQDGSVRGRFGDWVLPYDVATDGAQVYVIDASAPEVVVLSLDGQRVGSIPLSTAASYISMRDGTLHVA
jgi:DNA-binding beta-propeller fold protein YncE